MGHCGNPGAQLVKGVTRHQNHTETVIDLVR
jgi:hypothetical protein